MRSWNSWNSLTLVEAETHTIVGKMTSSNKGEYVRSTQSVVLFQKTHIHMGPKTQEQGCLSNTGHRPQMETPKCLSTMERINKLRYII